MEMDYEKFKKLSDYSETPTQKRIEELLDEKLKTTMEHANELNLVRNTVWYHLKR